MAPSYALGTHQQQSSTSHQPRKREGGLLTRLFGTLSSSIRQSSSTRRQGAGSSCYTAAIPTLPSAHAQSGCVACSAAAMSQQTSQAVGQNCCSSAPFLGYATDVNTKYLFGHELGKGGNGVVRVVRNRQTGEEFACKSIRKVLADASEKKKQGHIESIRREVQVLQKLRGSLNIVKLEDVYEDEECVHIVMEQCRGGELWHRIGDRHYSERTVASFMRAVLRTLAQCHAQHILHRDIKPGNFMLLTEDDRAPLQAIDFGLAAPFDPEQLPRTDLGLEGTPWYMAPETLRGDWLPASDVWSAGVMAYQLLSGRFPFDDKKNVYAPAITAIWRSVLNDPLDFSSSSWAGISEQARDFCRLLLARDPAARPSAKEALRHPWLRGDSAERSTGRRLAQSVVARIQRFASGSALQRSVLQAIAEELLQHPELLAGAGAGGAVAGGPGAVAVATAGAGAVAPEATSLAPLLQQLRLEGAGAVLSEAELGAALRRMGFRLGPGEVSRLMAGLDVEGSGRVGAAGVLASQLDWRHLQRHHTELWLQLAEKAFRSLDTDGSGVLEVGELLAALRARLPPEEVGAALEQALQQAAAGAGAGGAGAVETAAVAGGEEAGRGIDFEGFVSLLKIGSVGSLDLYDDRMSTRSGGSGHGATAASSLDRSYHSGSLGGGSLRGAAAALRSGDWSRHGSSSSRDNSTRGGGAASPPDSALGKSQRGGIVFRFDTNPSRAPVAAATGGISNKGAGAAGGLGPQGASSASASSASPAVRPLAGGAGGGGGVPAGGMVWRFDVGGPAAAPPQPPPAAPLWRFDVVGGGGKAAASRKAAAAATATPTSAATPIAAAAAAGAGGSQQQHQLLRPSEVGGLISSLGRRGGYCDRRMHGSDLYHNVALQAAGAGGQRLEVVAE
ncbi:hypothetical protein Agub_g5101 [Astrephomene gubernaculifera]|uniref:Uncharacterized protein n=1 Tax=Astrephomene gubernaculifera TaxID=47775 RepID=A0AAD3DNR9_9CHLO|nr:hypothetical protein Agub_g5101 [Astrephomene gubernaculifera]